MKDGKPFFFRIDLIELMDFATEPEGKRMSLLTFAKELKKGQSDYPAIQRIINEAHSFIAKKSESGVKGMKNRWLGHKPKKKKDNTVITSLRSVITNDNIDITSSSSSSSSSTETEDIKSKPLSVLKPKTDGGNGKLYPYQHILEEMNCTLSTKYKNTGTFKSLVRARINEGFSPEDFGTVCRKKFVEWGSDLKMMQYLRPETLFGKKMNDYLGSLSAGRPVGERERVNYAAGQAFLNEEDIWSSPTK